MFSRLPMFQRIGAAAYRPDLHNIQSLCEQLGHPEKNLKVIHVGGTNGKGSTSHLLASILQEAGYKTGLYTSPHLKDYRERIRVQGICIPENEVITFIQTQADFLAQHSLSFFEMTVGLAFWYLSSQEVDVAVIEVGLGGRLDATNVVDPILSIITNISYDHTDLLGETLAEIATEKAGIIKQGVPVVIGTWTPETKAVFEKVALRHQSPLFVAADPDWPLYDCPLGGWYQQQNMKTVCQSVALLRQQGWDIPEEAVVSGMQHVISNTQLRGRWEILNQQPLTIADTGHNEAGIQQIVAQLANLSYRHLHWVLGKVADKSSAKVLPLLPKDAIYYFCKPNIPRGQDAESLQQEAAAYDLHGQVYPSVAAAYQAAQQAANPTDCIMIAGSNFVVAEVL
ncbi:MAG: tetrahydrofolate synthase [Flavobacterium sp. BFFFF2]|nr:MAG: tetrahydrofolate synthase [Flavobacterium sp. BFFFF2]